MEHPLNESAWRRGWQDTLHGWKSVCFIILEAVLAPLLGLFVDWWWSIVAVVGGMLCIWIGATARAPVEQRNEARALLLTKPKPIPISNRDELIRAINKYAGISAEVFDYQDQIDQRTQVSPYTVDTVLTEKLNEALTSYKTLNSALDAELSVAGQEYRTCVSHLTDFIDVQLLFKVQKAKQIGGDKSILLNKIGYAIRLAQILDETLRKIDELSGRVPRKKGSQTE